ncbi:MAG: helix-turn-helix transcriptional regulator [Rickettsiales bacterium]|jgi:transcriptional regulator with XRE-family HTH domain|nr:helix-turn-helix transcriptional regulator [Rickettsiales bacterium]
MELDKEIIDHQRNTFKEFMQQQNLTPSSWAKKAGVTEATIRHYLSGRSQSLTSLVLEKLANSAGVSVSEIIGGKKFVYKNVELQDITLNRPLMLQTLIDVEEFINNSDLTIDAKEKAHITMAWYDLAQILKKEKRDDSSESYLEELINKTN